VVGHGKAVNTAAAGNDFIGAHGNIPLSKRFIQPEKYLR
jgi:hypothetical protein